ncbi:MAG: hypothetical protein CM15mP23_00530 [Cryomorphaceae bacterium]|nr:MAG: hypothetical protein CM15mP23_00530 [Cryomorphaceae bacterium]
MENFPNYNPLANTDDASCDPNSADIFGCMDDAYLEYDSTVTNDNGSSKRQ